MSDLLQTQAPVLSVAVSGSNTKYKETVESGMEPIVVAGNSEKLWFLGYDDNEVKRWEWVTDVATSSEVSLTTQLRQFRLCQLNFLQPL